jgi:hypothetical protein
MGRLGAIYETIPVPGVLNLGAYDLPSWCCWADKRADHAK